MQKKMQKMQKMQNWLKDNWLIKPKFAKKKCFFSNDFTPFISKNFQMWDHFFPLLFPKDSKFGKWGKKTFKRYLKS